MWVIIMTERNSPNLSVPVCDSLVDICFFYQNHIHDSIKLKLHFFFSFVFPLVVMPSPQFFDGQALVSWSDPDVTVAIPWYIGLMFRTRQPSGTLMQASVGPSSTINLMVRNK